MHKEKIQIFWDSGKGKHFESWSTMYKDGETVTFWLRNYDHEDAREYDYIGQFSVEDYKRAIEELQQTGSTKLTEPRGTLNMHLIGNKVDLAFLGTPSPCTTPSGAQLSGCVQEGCTIDKMLIKD